MLTEPYMTNHIFPRQVKEATDVTPDRASSVTIPESQQHRIPMGPNNSSNTRYQDHHVRHGVSRRRSPKYTSFYSKKSRKNRLPIPDSSRITKVISVSSEVGNMELGEERESQNDINDWESVKHQTSSYFSNQEGCPLSSHHINRHSRLATIHPLHTPRFPVAQTFRITPGTAESMYKRQRKLHGTSKSAVRKETTTAHETSYECGLSNDEINSNSEEDM